MGAVLLSIHPGPLWELEASDGRTRPVRAAVAPGPLSAVRASLRVLRRSPAVVLRGLDAARSKSEEQAGLAIGRLVASAEPVGRLVWAAAASARQQDEALVIIVDAAGEAARVPWELLDLGDGPLEGQGRGVVVRRVVGPAGRPLPPGVGSPVLWCEEPEDPGCARTIEALRAALSLARLPDPVPVAEAPTEGPLLLHVVAHGHVLAEGGVIEGARGRLAGAGTAAHGVAHLLPRSRLVVLDICESGTAAVPELDTVAGRIVRAGAPRCIAPLRQLSIEAAAAFSGGLYRALAAGATVLESTAAGRRAVRRLADPHPDARWNNLAVFIADRAVVDEARVETATWLPSGWGDVGGDIRSLLAAARAEAERLRSGFVGLEHLLLAQRSRGASGPLSAAAGQLADCAAIERLGKLRRLAGRDDDWRGSSRLRALASNLPPGAGIERLWLALWHDPCAALAALTGSLSHDLATGSASGETLEPDGTVSVAVPRHLEVLGGPEDGRLISPESGETVGRVADDGSTHHPLYAESVLVDPYLSRAALQWGEGGLVNLRRPSRRHDGAGWGNVGPGKIVVAPGDRILLAPGTCLRVLA